MQCRINTDSADGFTGGVGGGSVQYNKQLGWRWSMYISAICYAAQLVAQFFLGIFYPGPFPPVPRTTGYEADEMEKSQKPSTSER